MYRFISRVGGGLVCGALAGIAAFGTLSVLVFAFGLYSQTMIQVGILTGLVAGGISGPVVGLCRTPPLRAALWHAAIWMGLYLFLRVWAMSSQPGPAPAHALHSLAMGATFVAVAAAITGCASAWSSRRLESAMPRPEKELRHSTAGGGQRYWL